MRPSTQSQNRPKIVLPKPFGEVASDGKFLFEAPLLEARVLKRPNRFIVLAELDGKEVEVHCPTTGSIGGWLLDGLNCLVSGPYPTSHRRTAYTLEALEVPLADGSKSYVGINQNQANRYVEASALSGLFEEAIGEFQSLRAEKKHGAARIDFNINGDTFLEVKTPLKLINLDTLVPAKSTGYGSVAGPASTERLLRHVKELTAALEEGQKAILLSCFIYDAPRFDPPTNSAYTELSTALQAARRAGLESWQVNYEIDGEGVRQSSLQRIDLGKEPPSPSAPTSIG